VDSLTVAEAVLTKPAVDVPVSGKIVEVVISVPVNVGITRVNVVGSIMGEDNKVGIKATC
jgi:hypothetical protein